MQSTCGWFLFETTTTTRVTISVCKCHTATQVFKQPHHMCMHDCTSLWVMSFTEQLSGVRIVALHWGHWLLSSQPWVCTERALSWCREELFHLTLICAFDGPHRLQCVLMMFFSWHVVHLVVETPKHTGQIALCAWVLTVVYCAVWWSLAWWMGWAASSHGNLNMPVLLYGV